MASPEPELFLFSLFIFSAHMAANQGVRLGWGGHR